MEELRKRNRNRELDSIKWYPFKDINLDNPFGVVAVLMWTCTKYSAWHAIGIVNDDTKWVVEDLKEINRPERRVHNPDPKYRVKIKLKGGERIVFSNMENLW